MLAANLEKLLKALSEQQVEFVIIGGAAAVIHGSAYVTKDFERFSGRDYNDRTSRKTSPADSVIGGI